MVSNKDWIKVRKRWIKENPPNFQGYYECYICHKWIDQKDMTLDHVIPRSRRPDLAKDFDNLRPACYPCNSKKGSQVYIEGASYNPQQIDFFKH